MTAIATLEPTPTGARLADSDYERVRRSLEYLVEHAAEQPTLADMAAQAGLSEFHFQRVFTRWAGISPKKFLQFVTLQEARARLAANENLLDASLDVGLSGPGRLHDLFVTYEAVTPGTYRQAGEGTEITYGYCDSPFGRAVLLTTPRGVCGLGFADGDDAGAVFQEVSRPWQRATFTRDDAEAARVGDLAFRPLSERKGEPLGVVLRGSPFQLKVWEALLRIPEGSVVNYGQLAAVAGTGAGNASRAVGQAVGVNPVAYLIPCHRVIRASGALGGYRWGNERKLAMLGLERGRHAR